MPTENRSSNTEQMFSVPRSLLEEACNGLRITQDRARKGLRALLAQPQAQQQGKPVAAFKNCIDARGYLADLFKQRLRRHDFNQYITERLAGDFAFALANWLIAAGHADPGEVERLRNELAGTVAECQRRRNSCADLIAECATLRERLEIVKSSRDAFAQNAIDLRAQLDE
ncbi:hypothetical protein KH389_10725 [Pseudomonas qingdaonensis]|uniref:Uncharacterized protein n=1 Tax=Pseudomonas qingdaonensis TaxID=2056231 RepID=A0ABX8DXW0_9PSED|nr:hypothetical protein [Pseudomonas qingdaonensis]QVL21017.1 hypothetical protein KH389_10725 [Pseudomonas qingdaonensis]